MTSRALAIRVDHRQFHSSDRDHLHDRSASWPEPAGPDRRIARCSGHLTWAGCTDDRTDAFALAIEPSHSRLLHRALQLATVSGPERQNDSVVDLWPIERAAPSEVLRRHPLS